MTDLYPSIQDIRESISFITRIIQGEDTPFHVESLNISSGTHMEDNPFGCSSSTWIGNANYGNTLNFSIKVSAFDAKLSVDVLYWMLLEIVSHPLTIATLEESHTWYTCYGAIMSSYAVYYSEGSKQFEQKEGSKQFRQESLEAHEVEAFITMMEDFTGMSVEKFDTGQVIQ